LKPEQLPADSAPAPSPWPWAEAAPGDLFTPRNQHTTPPGSEEHATPPSPGRETLQALQAQVQANQPAPPSPQRATFPALPASLVTAGCVALAVVGGVVAVLMVFFHTRGEPDAPPPAVPPQRPAPTLPAVPTAAAVIPDPVTIPTPGAVTPTAAAAPTPAPNPAGDDTPTAAGAVPEPAPPHQAVTSPRSPAARPAPAPPAEIPAPQPNRPEWAGGDTQPAPDTPPLHDRLRPAHPQQNTHALVTREPVTSAMQRLDQSKTGTVGDQVHGR
jgi:hypothetical protein